MATTNNPFGREYWEAKAYDAWVNVLGNEQPAPNNLDYDAFRHAYISAIWTREFGSWLARQGGDWVEAKRVSNWTGGEEMLRDTRGDLLNNAIGRDVGKVFNKDVASDRQVAEILERATKSGDLIRDKQTDARTLPENFPSDFYPRADFFPAGIEPPVPAPAPPAGDPFTGMPWPGTDDSSEPPLLPGNGEHTFSNLETGTGFTLNINGNIIESYRRVENDDGSIATVYFDPNGNIVDILPYIPASPSPITSSDFQDRYEQEDITLAMYRVANLTEADIREIAAYEGLASLMAGATLNLNFSSFGSEVNSADEYTISVPSLANLVRAGMTVQEAVTSTLMNQLGTSLLASGFFGQEAEFDSTSFTNAIDSGNLSGFMDGLSQLEARSYLAQYFIKDSLDLEIPILNSEGEDLTAILNGLITGSVESVIDSVGGAIGALAGELRASMDVDKSGLMLNGSRDPDSPYRPQVTAGFMYLPQDLLLGMADPFETDFFPSTWELMQDADDADLEWTKTMAYRVYVDGVFVDHGEAFCLDPPSMHGRYHVGENPINRLTVFVNGQLYIDDYFDLSKTPHSYIGPSAVYSFNVQPGEHMYGNFWSVEPQPRYYNFQSSNSSFESLVDADEGMAAPSLTQSSATLLVQAMSEMGSAGTAPSFNVMRKDEPLLMAAN